MIYLDVFFTYYEAPEFTWRESVDGVCVVNSEFDRNTRMSFFVDGKNVSKARDLAAALTAAADHAEHLLAAKEQEVAA